MKVIVKENLGAEYASDLISSCNQSGIQAIADYTGNEILFYDPKNWLYGRHSDMMKDASLEDDIFSIFNGKNPELRAKVLKPAKGEDFREFAVEWNDLQKQESPDIIKTKNCSVIRFGANESTLSDGGMDDNVSEWYAERFPDDDLAGRINTRVTFQDVMDCIDYGADIYDLLETGDSTIRERLFAELAARTGIEYGKLYRKWLKNSAFDESLDNPNDWSASEDEVEIQWMIDDKELGIYSGEKETVVIDLGLVDCFEELVYQVELALEKAHGGMQFDYDDEWILVDEEELIKRFGYNMNESGSNGGTIDVTIKFTYGHHGKKLKAGDEMTIKLDTSTAPTIYDTDDMLTWIAEVASDQIPGGGEVTKYDFETIDPPDDVLIKAVMGDEGFGPDVDVDFDDPDSIPSEISYRDALKIYHKMYEAYDDRKLDYTKYARMRDKLIPAVVKGLMKEKSLDELAEEWFINYGTMNGWGWKTSFKYNVACALHDIHKKKHPDEHVVDREDTIRGWHSEKCSCGLGSSSDSSD